MDLDGFRRHLRSLGLQEGSIDLYTVHVRKAYEKDPVERLLDKKLAPKTRRACLAALRAYAKYTSDDKFLAHLSKMKLPRPDRLAPKFPLERKAWLKLRETIDDEDVPMTDALRAVLGLIATRGFRVGDVLRLQASEVKEARETAVLAFTAKGSRRLTYRAKNFVKYLDALATHKSWTTVADLISPAAEAETRHKAAVRYVERHLRRVAELAGLAADDIHPHKLRRTAAVYFLKELKGDPEAILKLKEWMQWADINTAMGYVDHLRGDELDVVEDRMVRR